MLALVRLRSLVILMAAAIATLAVVPPASAAKILDEVQSIDGQVITHPTNGEDIVLDGDVRVQIFQVDTSNVHHLRLVTRFQGVTGVGLSSGYTYRVFSRSVEASTVAEAVFPAVFRTQQFSLFLAPPGGDDVLVLTTFLMVFDANGNVTVSIDDMRTIPF